MKRSQPVVQIPREDLLRRYEDFYRLHFPMLSRYVARRLPPESHDEIVAAAFVAAWKKFPDVESPSLPWLYRIASFEVAHERRRLGRLPEVVTLSDINLTDEYGLEDVMDISSAFSQLSESDQEVLRLVYWEDLRRTEIAQVLGCSINVVNVRIHRALERFRGAMSRTEATTSPDPLVSDKKDDQ